MMIYFNFTAAVWTNTPKLFLVLQDRRTQYTKSIIAGKKYGLSKSSTIWAADIFHFFLKKTRSPKRNRLPKEGQFHFLIFMAVSLRRMLYFSLKGEYIKKRHLQPPLKNSIKDLERRCNQCNKNSKKFYFLKGILKIQGGEWGEGLDRMSRNV